MANNNEFMHQLVNYPRDISGDRFLYSSFNNSESEALRATIKDMLMAPTTDPIEKMDLINSLCRLGVSYHFENEIEEQLSHLFITLVPELLLGDNEYDLYTVALVFQVFRFNGYEMPCGVFGKFQYGHGKFKEELISNVKGMVGLYEASHFRTRGEVILDEGLEFTTRQLRSLANQSSTSPHLRQYIENALERPYVRSIRRLTEARLRITFHENLNESRNDIGLLIWTAFCVLLLFVCYPCIMFIMLHFA